MVEDGKAGLALTFAGDGFLLSRVWSGDVGSAPRTFERKAEKGLSGAACLAGCWFECRVIVVLPLFAPINGGLHGGYKIICVGSGVTWDPELVGGLGE